MQEVALDRGPSPRDLTMESRAGGEDKGGKGRTSMRGGAEARRPGGGRGDVDCCNSKEVFL